MAFRFETANERWSWYKKALPIYDVPGRWAIPDPDNWPIEHEDLDDDYESYEYLDKKRSPKNPFGRGFPQDEKGNWRRDKNTEEMIDQEHEEWKRKYINLTNLENEKNELSIALDKSLRGSIDPSLKDEINSRLEQVISEINSLKKEMESDQDNWRDWNTKERFGEGNKYFHWVPNPRQEKSWKNYRERQYRPVEGKKNI